MIILSVFLSLSNLQKLRKMIPNYSNSNVIITSWNPNADSFPIYRMINWYQLDLSTKIFLGFKTDKVSTADSSEKIVRRSKHLLSFHLESSFVIWALPTCTCTPIWLSAYLLAVEESPARVSTAVRMQMQCKVAIAPWS